MAMQRLVTLIIMCCTSCNDIEAVTLFTAAILQCTGALFSKFKFLPCCNFVRVPVYCR